MIYAVTGHRPHKILAAMSSVVAHVPLGVLDHKLTEFAADVLKARPVAAVIVGMAEGFDMAVAEAAYNLSIPFLAAVPFVGQESKWGGRSQERYRRLCALAHRVEIISPHTLNIAYQKRDEWMVDQAQKGGGGTLLSLYSGQFGGTANTVKYAEDWMMPVDNVWDEWIARWTSD